MAEAMNSALAKSAVDRGPDLAPAQGAQNDNTPPTDENASAEKGTTDQRASFCCCWIDGTERDKRIRSRPICSGIPRSASEADWMTAGPRAQPVGLALPHSGQRDNPRQS